MSLYDYRVSRQLVSEGPSFDGLLMAAMRTADSQNIELLKRGWPDVWNELKARHLAPDGVFPSERAK